MNMINTWNDWQWQNTNAIRDIDKLKGGCSHWNSILDERIKKNLSQRRFQITPYYLKLIQDSLPDGDSIEEHPLWRLVVPFWNEESLGGYDGESENWELDHEMKTPICQHKYDNRVILRTVNSCVGYCQFCFEALRVLENNSNKIKADNNSFDQSVDYIKNNPNVEEVILSGGDPLIMSDKKLEKYLQKLRSINNELLIRIHSRSLTYNPYRITDSLINILKKYKVNSFGVHVCHPLELSSAFQQAIQKLNEAVPIIFSNMPLLKGINDDKEILHKLFIDLYRLGVKPYYLYHFMPFSPGASVYKVSIKEAIFLMNQLKRRVSNIALPEYVLPHVKGKFTVPLIEESEQFPRFEQEGENVFYRFTNWEGDNCEWCDN